MTTSLLRFSYLALLATLLAACSGGGTTILNNASGVSPGLDSIEIDATNPIIAKGTSTQLSATVLYGDNSHADASSDLTWTSSNLAVATVSSSGEISAISTGTATISGTCAVASVCGTASASITVTVTSASLVSISLAPAAPRLARGTSQQFMATGIFSDNSTQALNADLTWTSSNPAVATVNSSGLVSTLSAGSTTITATCSVASVCGSLAGTSTVTVASASLVSIAITPPAPSLAAGTSQQFTATGTFSDNSTQALNADLTWTSSSPAVATVSSSGLVSTVGVGGATITATCKVATVCGSLSGNTTVTVTAATLVSIEVTPSAPNIALGTNETFAATGTYSDNSTQNLTNQVTWTSATPAVATISNAAGTAGVAHPVAAGSTPITAALGTVASPAVTLTVTAATLVSIAITPPAPSVALGVNESFTATGTYSDNSTQNLTTQVTWASAAPAVATISNAAGTAGVAYPVAAGMTQITAALGGVTSPAVTLTVTAATLVSIAITPPAPSVALGVNETFTATGTYSDNSTQDLTAQVTWASATPAVATISNAAGTAGVAHPAATGTTQITAALGSVISPAVTLTVTAATLVSIAITPPAPSVALGVNESFTATGTYSDNSTQNLTTQVTWASATPAVATISNAAGTAGVAHPAATGTTQITAALGGVTSPAVTLTVTAATLVSIAITPPAPSVAFGVNETFTATGTYSDNSTQDLTAQVTWASATPAVATISNAAGTAGVAYPVAAGMTQITAALGGVTSPAVTLTVTAATLVSIAITPTGPSIPVAASEQFTATGTYSDNSTQNLTNQVTWASATPAVATVSNANNSQGLATGLQVGSTSISATSGGVTSPAVTLTVTTQVESVLWSFGSGSDGQTPYSGVIQYTDGNFYGTTSAGGANGDGIVFKITPTGAETVIHSFGNGSDGTEPWGTLIVGTDGNFYGTTVSGGTHSNAGTVFKITPTGVETVLYSFGSVGDGTHPFAALIQGTDGNFYGTTLTGGANGAGTVFKLTPAGVETLLWSFGSGSDGAYPQSALIQGTDGNFYGTTLNGGANSTGTVFRITPTGVETVLYSFGTGIDAQTPFAALLQGVDGNFYGTTQIGGAYGLGTVFEITSAGVESVLWSFGNGSDGQSPYAGLTQGADGNFYGTTETGGSAAVGTIFKITPAGVETVLYSFSSGSGLDGSDPLGGLVQGTDGNFYATTSTGGANSYGTVFKF